MMKNYKSWVGVTIIAIMAVVMLSSCGSSSKYACPNRIDVLP